MQQAIAILDSGVGGLTVAKEVMRQLPREKIIYFGDTARAPYGPRNPEEVALFTEQIVEYLLQFHPKMIVIACNTATAVALDRIRSQVPVPVIGVIHPGARAAINKTRTGMVGVIGTEGTVRSQAYDRALRELSPNVQIMSKACPRLVPLVEKGLFAAAESKEIVFESLSSLQSEPIDCLILGCTHYPFLQDVIQDVMGPHIDLINSAEETAREISAILYHRNNLAQAHENPVHHFYCSGDPLMFQRIAQMWLDQEVHVTSMTWPMSQIV